MVSENFTQANADIQEEEAGSSETTRIIMDEVKIFLSWYANNISGAEEKPSELNENVIEALGFLKEHAHNDPNCALSQAFMTLRYDINNQLNAAKLSHDLAQEYIDNNADEIDPNNLAANYILTLIGDERVKAVLKPDNEEDTPHPPAWT